MEKQTHRLYLFSALLLVCCSRDKGVPSDIDLVGQAKGGGDTGYAVDARKDYLTSRETSADTFSIDLIEDLVFRKQRDGWTLQTSSAHVNVEKLRKSGLDLILSAIQMNQGAESFSDLQRSLQINETLIAETGGKLKLVSSFRSARENSESGIVSVMVYLEGADGLVGHTDQLGLLRQRGVGVVGLVGGRANQFADAALDLRKPGGVTEKGYELLEKCRDFNVVVDLTHASYNTFWDALVAQAGKVMVNHTAASAIREHPRNLDDLQILALARYGGVLGLVFNPDFLKTSPEQGATIQDVVEHIMHIRSIGAAEALAIGTDYGGIHPPLGLEDVSKLPRLFEALEQQGLSHREIEGIRGNNAARLFEEIERKRGAVLLSQNDILRPVAVECESVAGEAQGKITLACDRDISQIGVTLEPTSRQRFRLQDVSRRPVKLEVFGQPNSPWQVVGQNLEGRVLFTRMLALNEQGKGELSLPGGRNLTRVFLSPTRRAHLKEVVVWGN